MVVPGSSDLPGEKPPLGGFRARRRSRETSRDVLGPGWFWGRRRRGLRSLQRRGRRSRKRCRCAPIGQPDLLEKFQVDGVVHVTVGVEVAVADLEARNGWWVLQAGSPNKSVATGDCTHSLRVPSDLMG